MDRLVKIILLIIGLSAAFIWMSNSFSACKSDASQSEAVSDLDSGSEEELFEGGDIDYSTSDENDPPMDEIIEEDEPEEAVVQQEVDFTKPPSQQKRTVATSKPAASRPKATAGSSYGSYMVIAGNYLLDSNAEIMTVKLKDLGFRDAYIAIFDNSQYHTVIAARYDNFEAANSAVSDLKAKGVDCYVKSKK